jgi:hypothetical protein
MMFSCQVFLLIHLLLIVENLYAQIDVEGHAHIVFKDIVNHRCNDKDVANNTYVDKHERIQPQLSTAGWELEVQWIDGTMNWLPLKDLKDSNPIETAEYAISNKLADEPAVIWWVCNTLRSRDQFISKVKTGY